MNSTKYENSKTNEVIDIDDGNDNPVIVSNQEDWNDLKKVEGSYENSNLNLSGANIVANKKETKRGGKYMWGNNSEMSKSIPDGVSDNNDEFIDVSYNRHPNPITKFILALIKYFDLGFNINVPKSQKSKNGTSKTTTSSDKIPQSAKGTRIIEIDSSRLTIYNTGYHKDISGYGGYSTYDVLTVRDSVKRAKQEKKLKR